MDRKPVRKGIITLHPLFSAMQIGPNQVCGAKPGGCLDILLSISVPIDFGSTENLDVTELENLRRWYYYYHRLAVCYGWAYKRFRRFEVSLKMISTTLTIVGAALSPVSMPTLALAGVGVCVRTYVDANSLQSSVEKYRLARSSYLKVLMTPRC